MIDDGIIFADPEEIAHSIFSKNPIGKLTYQIIPNNGQEIDFYEAHRILITILFEGMDIFTDGLHQFTSDDIEMAHFLAMNPWFHDLGINLICTSVNKSDDNMYANYYCKSIIKEQSYKFLFDKNNIEKNYHFMINNNFVNSKSSTNNIHDIYSIFISGNNVYKIAFELHYDQV